MNFKKVDNWLKSKTNTVFCIRAAAGMGKSVLSYKLVTDHTKICIGYFFFDFSEEKRISLRVAVTSILMQLAETFPEVKTFLVDQLEGEAKRKSILESLDALLNELLLGALRTIPAPDSNGYSIFFYSML